MPKEPLRSLRDQEVAGSIPAPGSSVPATLADVRALALTLPRTHEGAVRGRVKFYVGRIVYLAFSRDETLMGFAFPREWREAAVESEPDRYVMPTGGDLRYNWLIARMAALDAETM